MDDDRSLSALIARLEALSWRDAAERAKPKSQRPAPRGPLTRLTARRALNAWAWLVVGGILAVGAFAGYCHFVELEGPRHAERPTARVSGSVGSATP